MRQVVLGILIGAFGVPNPQWMTYQFETLVLTITGDQWTPEWSPWDRLLK